MNGCDGWDWIGLDWIGKRERMFADRSMKLFKISKDSADQVDFLLFGLLVPRTNFEKEHCIVMEILLPQMVRS